jgi:hypothetical protein
MHQTVSRVKNRALFLAHASRALVAGLLLATAVSSHAHDPYEITATAYLYSNRVDLDVVMEFRTGMRLAGLAPRPPAGISNSNWFAGNQAGLQTCAQSFCELQAGGKLLPVKTVATELLVEDHIKLQVTYPPATERPLRFNLAGLRTLAGQGQYGVALTVLDMVNSKVLGQPVIFADEPTLAAQLPTPTRSEIILPVSTEVAGKPAVIASQPASPTASSAKQMPGGGLGVSALILGVAALMLLFLARCRYRRKS